MHPLDECWFLIGAAVLTVWAWVESDQGRHHTSLVLSVMAGAVLVVLL